MIVAEQTLQRTKWNQSPPQNQTTSKQEDKSSQKIRQTAT
jgi:hypothetical protein